LAVGRDLAVSWTVPALLLPPARARVRTQYLCQDGLDGDNKRKAFMRLTAAGGVHEKFAESG